MTKTTELAIRAHVAVNYPGWRVDFIGPGTVVLTNVMGRRRTITCRQRRRRRDGPWMRKAKWIISRLQRIARQIVDAAEWIVVSVIWLLGMWMVASGIMAWVMRVI